MTEVILTRLDVSAEATSKNNEKWKRLAVKF